MRKLLVGIVILVGLGLALAPVAGGILTERAYASAARGAGIVQPVPGLRIQLDPALYERGLFRSKAWTTVDLPGAAGRVVLVHTIHHGPFSYARLGDGLALGVIESSVDPARLEPGQASPIHMTTTLKLNRDLHIELEGAPVTTAAFTFDGASGNLDVVAQGEEVTGTLQIKGWRSAQDAEPRVSIEQSLLEIDLQAGETGVPLGSASYTASALEFRRNGRTTRLKDVVIDQEGELDAEQQHIASTVHLTFGALDLPGRSFRNGEFKLEARNIDAQAVADLKENRSAIAPSQLRKAVQDAWPQLLAAGPELELTLAKVTTDGGPLDLYAKLTGRPEMANLPLSNTVTALAMFDLNARADLSPEHLETASLAAARAQARMIGANPSPNLLEATADAMTQEFIRQGYLIADEESGALRYKTELSYRNGSIQLNDRPINPTALLALRHAGGGSQ